MIPRSSVASRSSRCGAIPASPRWTRMGGRGQLLELLADQGLQRAEVAVGPGLEATATGGPRRPRRRETLAPPAQGLLDLHAPELHRAHIPRPPSHASATHLPIA